MAKKNYDQAKKICASFLADNPCSISLWKVYHYVLYFALLIAYEIKASNIQNNGHFHILLGFCSFFFRTVAT